MALSRKKPLTELEKLETANCVGRRFIRSRRVTPENNNAMSDARKNSIIDVSDIRQNLTNVFDDAETSSSDDSSFKDEISEVEDEIIKVLPDETTNDSTENEVPSKDIIFPAEVIEKLHLSTDAEVSTEDCNLWVDEGINDKCHEITQDAGFADVPLVLVDDDDSVLFPCNENDKNRVNHLEQTNYEKEMEKIRNENKKRMVLCKTLLGNVILDTMQLEKKITSNLLCLHCLQETKWDNKTTEDITALCGVIVRTERFGFACRMIVECVNRHHVFSVDPERAPPHQVLDGKMM